MLQANDLIRLIDERYSSCQTYVDEGVLETFTVECGALSTNFRTFFERPNRIRIDWSALNSPDYTNHALYNNGSVITLAGAPFQIEETNSLAKHLACVTAVSLGLPLVIPPILLPKLDGFEPLTKLSTYQFEDAQMALTPHCRYIVRAKSKGASFLIYLDAEGIIRQVDLETIATSSRADCVKATYRYLTASFDTALSSEVFAG